MTRGDANEADDADDADADDAGAAVQPTPRPAWRGFVIAVAVVLALAVGVGLLGRVVRPGAPADAGSPSGTVTSTADPLVGQVQRVLDQRSAALAAGDLTGWLRPLDPSATAFVTRQREVFRVLRELDVRSLRWSVARVLAPTASGGQRVEVAGEWTVPGVDVAPAPFVTVLTVRAGSPPSAGSPTTTPTTLTTTSTSATVLVDDVDDRTTRQAFDLAGARVERHGRAVVLGTAPSERLTFYAQAADMGLGEVSRTWAEVPARVLVLAPATVAQFRTLSGRSPSAGDQVAAVTYGSVAEGRTARGDRVVLNPAAWDRLSPTGRQIVLTHELTHVAVRASTTHAAPQWLSEGFATWVAYGAHPVDPERTAAPVLQQVRSGHPPQRLPADQSFDAGDVDLAYAEAWTLCRYLADRSGRAALVDLTRRVGRGESLADALPAATGLTEQTLVAGWVRSLQSADSSGPP